MLCGVRGNWRRTLVACAWALEAWAAAAVVVALHHGLHGHWVHAAGAAHHVLGVGGARVAGAAAAHHLRLHGLHGHWVHAAHGVGHAAAAALLGEGLLHLLEVLLHALPVLGHHGGGHGAIGTLLGSALLVIVAASAVVVAAVTVAALVAVVELVVAAELLVAAVVVAHVASGLGALDLDGLAENLERLAKSGIDSGVAVKGDESETTRTSGLLVHHQCGIDNPTELLEELGKVFLSRFLADTTDKNLARALLLLTRNSPLRVNLVHVSVCVWLGDVDLRSCHRGSAPSP
jgi:hypothetical protein